MNIIDEFLKTGLDKGNVEVTKDIVGSMHLIDFGVITRQYDDGTCDVTCIKSNKNGEFLKYHGVEILYPCGIKNMQVNQMCILVNPFSSVYRTEDIENPDFIGDHDQRCIKAIPVSNRITDIFAGIDIGGNFCASNGKISINMQKWSAYFGTTENGKAGVSIYQDGTVCIDACNGTIHMLLHNTDGLGFIHYSNESPVKALEAVVLKPNGEKYSLYFCSEPFTFTKISDILDIGKDKWKRVEYTDTNGVFKICPGDKWSGADRHLATSEDLKALWDAFKNHTHYYTWSDSGGNGNTNTVATYPANPKQVAGIIVKDGDDA